MFAPAGDTGSLRRNFRAFLGMVEEKAQPRLKKKKRQPRERCSAHRKHSLYDTCVVIDLQQHEPKLGSGWGGGNRALPTRSDEAVA